MPVGSVPVAKNQSKVNEYMGRGSQNSHNFTTNGQNNKYDTCTQSGEQAEYF